MSIEINFALLKLKFRSSIKQKYVTAQWVEIVLIVYFTHWHTPTQRPTNTAGTNTLATTTNVTEITRRLVAMN